MKWQCNIHIQYTYLTLSYDKPVSMPYIYLAEVTTLNDTECSCYLFDMLSKEPASIAIHFVTSKGERYISREP
jgi:hypothetical protein